MTPLIKPVAAVTLGLIGLTQISSPVVESLAISTQMTKATPFSGGDGTQASPYLIATVEDLVTLRTEVNGGNSMANTYFKLTQNLDLGTIEEWTPIGTSASPFKGVFDGGGYQLSNLTIHQSTTDYVGLFGYVGDPTTRASRISNVTLNKVSVSGGNYASALAAYVFPYTTIENIKVDGTISGQNFVGGILGQLVAFVTAKDLHLEGTVSGANTVGGLVATAANGSKIQSSYLNATVTGSGQQVGGIIGTMSATAEITQSESLGKVSSPLDKVGGLAGELLGGGVIRESVSQMTVNGRQSVGGLAGSMTGSFIYDAYALGSVTGQTDVGGLTGYMASGGMIRESYSLSAISGTSGAGALIGQSYNGPQLINSYWDNSNPLPAVGTSLGASTLTPTGLPRASFNRSQAKDNLLALNFGGTWKLSETHPLLAWQQAPGEMSIEGDIQGSIVSFTVPTALSFEINPNLEAGSQFVAPDFTLSNDSSSPLTISVSTFEETSAYGFVDVLSNHHSDVEWAKLGVKESNQLALGVSLNTPDEWLEQTQAEVLHAVTVQESELAVQLGTTKPHSSVGLTFVGKHGAAFKEAMTPTYQLTFIFELLV